MFINKDHERYYAQKSWNNTEGRVEISEEVYKTYMRPIWKKGKQRQREAECRDKNTLRCNGDCDHCSHAINNRPLSLDQMEIDGTTPASAMFPSPETQTVKCELYRALYAEISAFNQLDKKIIELFSEGKTEREIAPIVGVSQRTVNNHKKTMFDKLNHNLQEYRDFYFSNL